MLGACADVLEVKSDADKETDELFSSNSELPPEYREKLLTWMRKTLFKDSRIVAQTNGFAAAVRIGEPFPYPGTISFSSKDSLPTAVEGGDERLDFMLNTNFRFTDDSGLIKLDDGEVVVRCDVTMTDVEKLRMYFENGIHLEKYGRMLSLTLVYNTHDGSIRKFPRGDMAEDFLKSFNLFGK